MSFQDYVARGQEFAEDTMRAAERANRKRKINNQLSDVKKDRQKLMAQLGASLYEQVRTSSELSLGKEELLAKIAECDARWSKLSEQMDDVLKEEQESKSYTCAVCGTSMREGDKFCGVCGASAKTAKDAEAEPDLVCSNCGGVVRANDAFCMRCGARLVPLEPPAQVEPAAPVEEPAAEVEDPTEEPEVEPELAPEPAAEANAVSAVEVETPAEESAVEPEVEVEDEAEPAATPELSQDAKSEEKPE